MKKLIALISAIAVMGTMSMTAFAKIEVAPNAEEAGAALAANSTSGYDASFTSADVNTQTTILAVNGTKIDTNSIMYINQLAQDSETTINFDLKETPKVGETVYVYMGGDKLAKKTVGTIKGVADASSEYSVTYMVGDAEYSKADTKDGVPVLPAEPTKADDGSKKYAFIGWYNEAGLTTKLDKTAAISEAKTVYAKFVQVGIHGDANADGSVSAADVTQIQKKIMQGDNYTGSAATLIECYKDANGNAGLYGDANADGSVSAADVTQIQKKIMQGDNYVGTAATEMVIQKD